MTTRTLRIGGQFTHEASYEIPAMVMIEQTDPTVETVESSWTTTPELALTPYTDLYGNVGQRLVLPSGESVFEYTAVVRVPDQLDEQDAATPLLPPDELPAEVLPYLLPSRYCQSDLLSADAWRLFGEKPAGFQRVLDIQDWVWNHITYRTGSTNSSWTAVDAFTHGYGICRDFAHTMVALCRAMNVPARYISGYLPELDVPTQPIPMDFHAWCQVFAGDRWWTLDPRHNQRRKGHVVICRGRDAADCALVTTFGAPTLKRMIVTAHEIADPAAGS